MLGKHVYTAVECAKQMGTIYDDPVNLVETSLRRASCLKSTMLCNDAQGSPNSICVRVEGIISPLSDQMTKKMYMMSIPCSCSIYRPYLIIIMITTITVTILTVMIIMMMMTRMMTDIMRYCLNFEDKPQNVQDTLLGV